MVDDEMCQPVVRPKKYTLLTDDVLKDPFDPVELSVHANKVVSSQDSNSPPRLFPAFTTQPPPARDEPRHTWKDFFRNMTTRIPKPAPLDDRVIGKPLIEEVGGKSPAPQGQFAFII